MRLLFVLIFFITGCSSINGLSNLTPRDHDNALVSSFISLSIKLDKIDCKTKNGIDSAMDEAEWLNRYSIFMNDPYADVTGKILNNIKLSKILSEQSCNHYVNLSKIRMNIVKKSWSTR